VVEQDRRRGRTRTRVLYWFRTPPGVKVGRAALDDDAIHLIEQLNPGIAFDWPRILKGQGVPPTESRPPAEARRQRPEPRRHQQPPWKPEPGTGPQRDSRDAPPATADEARAVERETEPVHATESGARPMETPAASDVVIAAHARLGVEGVRRLRARYAEIVGRIAEKTDEPERREELKAQADRLNPDAWTTDEDVAQGLEQYESVLASLREVAGQRRRRRRRGRGPGPAEPDDDPRGSPVDSSGAAADRESSDSTGGSDDGGEMAPE
jgi:hypothetical protein